MAGDDGVGSTAQAPVAVAGVVPVKAEAVTLVFPLRLSIHPGDLLTSSWESPGYAMKAPGDTPVGAIIGKALEGLDEGRGVIKMMVWPG